MTQDERLERVRAWFVDSELAQRLRELHEKAMERRRAMTLQQTMEALYASEINCGIDSFWDGGWRVLLGDATNGYRAEETFRDLNDAPAWMITQAIKHWPDSEFAKSHAKPVDNAQGS